MKSRITPSSVFRSEEWSMHTWIVAVLGVVSLGVLVSVLASYVLFGLFGSVWVDWSPGRFVGHYLVGTPLDELAAPVRWFITIYAPGCVLVFLAGFAIARLFGRKWVRMSVVFLLGFLIASHIAEVSTLTATAVAVYSDDWAGALQFVVFTGFIYGAVFLGGGLGRRTSKDRGHDSGNCAWCGYPLCGLPEPRCPECGTAFDPGAFESAVGAKTKEVRIGVR